jgi:hypothetical protein
MPGKCPIASPWEAASTVHQLQTSGIGYFPRLHMPGILSRSNPIRRSSVAWNARKTRSDILRNLGKKMRGVTQSLPSQISRSNTKRRDLHGERASPEIVACPSYQRKRSRRPAPWGSYSEDSPRCAVPVQRTRGTDSHCARSPGSGHARRRCRGAEAVVFQFKDPVGIVERRRPRL